MHHMLGAVKGQGWALLVDVTSLCHPSCLWISPENALSKPVQGIFFRAVGLRAMQNMFLRS
jgi:hypothetical protein